MKSLSELSVAEVQELLLPDVDDDGEPIEYEYTWTGHRGTVYTNHAQLNSWSAWDEIGGPHVFFMPGLGRVEMISHDSGGGGATDREMVWRITSLVDGSTRLFIKTGVWVSHDGVYWDGDFRETSQKQKVVTYYE